VLQLRGSWAAGVSQAVRLQQLRREHVHCAQEAVLRKELSLLGERLTRTQVWG
jgi:hypothetical protein